MLKQKMILKKGYTVTITSWENDADHYATKSKTYDTLEYSMAILTMLKELLGTNYGSENCIANLSNEGKEEEVIIRYIREHEEILNGEILKDEILLDFFQDIHYDLLGNSDFYPYRVFETGDIVFSPIDIMAEEVLKIQ